MLHEEVAGLHEEVAALHEAVGAPSLDELTAAAIREGCPVSRSALNDLQRGRGWPHWRTVEGFVLACAAHARRPNRTVLEAGRTDLEQWRRLHQGGRRRAPAGERDVVAALARHHAGLVERAGLPHYIPAGLTPAALDQPRQVRHAPRHGAPTRVTGWESAATTTPRIVLLADAGYGKSWLLRMYARHLGRGILERPGEDAIPAPVLLRCGELAARPEATLGAAVAAHLTGQGLLPEESRSHVVRLLGAGRLHLLLDAYDELPDTAARSALHALFVTAPAGLRCVVSGRQAGYPGPPPDGVGPAWEEHHLEPFAEPQTRAVIDVWPLTSAARASLTERLATPGLTGLAQVPLLLALLCALAEEVPPGGGAPDLPASKGELYERMLRRFLVHEHRPPAADDTDADRLLGVLAPVAHHFATQPDGWADVMPREAVLRAIRAAGEPFAELGRDAASVLRTLSVEAGIFQPLGDPSAGRVQPYLFAHRSFAEYLTSRHLAALPEAQTLAAVDAYAAAGERWDDTLAMLGRLTRTGEGRARFERLLRHLLEPEGQPLRTAHAVRMLGDLGERAAALDPLVRDLTLRRWRELTAADPVHAVRVVASCRVLPDEIMDLLVEFLVLDVDNHTLYALHLARHPHPSVTDFLIRAADRPGDPTDGFVVMTTMRNRPGAAVLEYLLEAFRPVTWHLNRARDETRHLAAVQALRDRRDPGALAVMIAAAEQERAEAGENTWWRDLRIRTGAVRVLGGYPGDPATAALLAATGDAESLVRNEAMTGLAGRDTPEVRAAVLAALREDGEDGRFDPQAVREVARSLGMRAD
ncbi:NACHT domain-containing protein [Streptomyces nojiriensis]|uniref:NACHT domain-containing protein n=1 Tax=Streptomyces nojiriensis TaxID=66374 RepID=UPI0035DA2A92